MKKILITGANSYIGTSFENWLSKYPDRYIVNTVDMMNDSWKNMDFSPYDVVFHVAGIAHIKETKKNSELYYKVNRDLVYETAKKAKKDGIRQFIFLSSMSVYGIDKGIIDQHTTLNPKSNYGKSKLQAEKLILSLEENDFKISIIRPPMVYGRGCKGNYPRLAKLALKSPIFPNINNIRSMIFIDNLCEFIRILIDDCSSGVFFPQNKEYVRTSEMVRLISEVHGKKVKLTKLFNPIIKKINLNIFNKVFGNLIYDMKLSDYDKEYRICDFYESINKTESGKPRNKKVIFVATVVKHHIMVFHIPYLEWFKKNGYEVHVAAKNDYENKEDCKIPFCDKFYDIPFERLPLKRKNIYALKKLKEIMKSNDYDIIHCHTPVGGVIGRLAARNIRKTGSKVVYTAHGFHFYKGAPLINWLLYYPVEKRLARYTDVLITINREDYQRASKSFKAGKIEYVPGVGIDIKRITETVVDKPAKRKELGLPENAFIAVSVGELSKRKNHEVIIKAMARLNNPKLYYIICGQGELSDYLLNLSKKLGIEKQVKLLGYRKDIVEINKISDAFVFPSYQEGLSVALMEAMACGLPVVCSDIRGNVDLIENAKGGYLVNPDDINGFVKALDELISNNAKCLEFGKTNIGKIANYDLEAVLKEMSRIYAGLI